MTPLVLLPGHMCDARMWAPQMAAFSGTRTIHLPELSGADGMAALAADVLAQAPPRFALAGLSMGGIVAMEVLRQAPERVDRLALLDTNPLPEAEAVKADRRARMARVEGGLLDAVVMTEMKPHYLAAGPRRTDLLDLCLAMARDLGPEVFLRQSRALMDRPDQTATLAAFRGPALVLMGEEDRLCPLDRHRLMAELMPQARLEIVPGAGHLPPLEQPEATNAALRGWLGA
jgi:pimeloyl-ACP methyl ester carboxylesterase